MVKEFTNMKTKLNELKGEVCLRHEEYWMKGNWNIRTKLNEWKEEEDLRHKKYWLKNLQIWKRNYTN